MNDIKLKPFDLQKCIAGEPVIFRNGEPYKFGAYNPDARIDNCVLGWDITGCARSHKVDGTNSPHSNDPSDYDLFMAPQEKELWIGIYKYTHAFGKHYTTEAYPSEEEYRKNYGTEHHELIKITIQQ